PGNCIFQVIDLATVLVDQPPATRTGIPPATPPAKPSIKCISRYSKRFPLLLQGASAKPRPLSLPRAPAVGEVRITRQDDPFIQSRNSQSPVRTFSEVINQPLSRAPEKLDL